ncbi:MAG TPA: zinc metalloprotease HtpX [Candidatus Sulfotelmatobacter sp.]|jgi:heat shock protein HtpX|nr:zinc metalloprotease HtpX [Candidatus Sulfotelmatobacter sp.]
MDNRVKTVLLLGAMTGLILLIGDLLGGGQGLMMAFLLAVVMNFGGYWFSDRLALWSAGAQEVTEAEAPELHRIIRSLCQRAGLPMPRVCITPEDAPNAFATGRNPQHAAVAVTQGMLRIATPEELEGVLAHELSHVRHRDILISSIAATLAGAIMVLARMAMWLPLGGRSDDDEGGSSIVGMVVLAVLAPIAAMLIQMAISRSREFLADEGAARLTHKPWALASALEKLERAAQQVPMASADPATSHMYIVNPLKGVSLMSLFRTHPPTEERIARLQAMRGV